MLYPASSDVAPDDDLLSAQYNNLREDVLNHTESHQSGGDQEINISGLSGVSSEQAAHTALKDAHGATNEATADRIVLRDTYGRGKVGDPSADADIATKKYADERGLFWDVLGITDDAVSLDVSSKDTYPYSIFVSPNGFYLYVLGSQNKKVLQYLLTTAWDLSTGSYEMEFSIASQVAAGQGLFFKPNGKKMYVLDHDTDYIYQYSLATAWNVTTASYDSKSFSVGSQDTSPSGLFMKPDGTKIYVGGWTNDRIYQYTLSTPWDVSTASYDSKYLSTTGQATYPTGIMMRSDGRTLIAYGYITCGLYQYTLEIPWDISTTTYDGKFIAISKDNEPGGFFMKPDGSRVYVTGHSSMEVHQLSGANAVLATEKDVAVHTEATTGIHGATSAPTASKLIIRDNAGRAQVTAPLADDDIARKSDVDEVNDTIELHRYSNDHDHKYYRQGEIDNKLAFVGCRLYNSTGETTIHDTLLYISFDTESYDTDSMHEGVTNPSRITIKTAGIYEFGALVRWVANAVGQRRIIIDLNRITNIYMDEVDAVSDPARPTYNKAFSTYEFAADDFIEVRVEQTSGGDLDIAAAAAYSPVFWTHKIGDPTS